MPLRVFLAILKSCGIFSMVFSEHSEHIEYLLCQKQISRVFSFKHTTSASFFK